MSMNFPVNLKKAIYASVVPVKCGDDRGTAFFISPDTLITARHIVVDNVLNAQPILIKTGEDVLCDIVPIAEDGENVDVVLLKCKDYRQDDFLKLLSAEFNEDRKLTIVGYPKEFGNCTELISIDVQDRLGTKKEDYDTMVVRTDSLAFTSYKGFSGSPVLNEKGSVIGISVNQYGNSLGYVSVKNITERLKIQHVEVSMDWQSEDFSPCGRGTSQRQVEKAISYAALRYNRDLHVSNKKLDDAINLFCLRKERTDIETKLKEIENIALHDTLDFQDCLTDYKREDFEDLLNRLYYWHEEHEEKELSSNTQDFYRESYIKLPPLVEKWEQTKPQIVFLKGNAGMGKTHYVCATAERLCKKMNVYLLFGSRFIESRDFESQLYEMMLIAGNDLIKLNDEMVRVDSNALIIIDALNEGATEIFWDIALRHMATLLEKCERIKLLITFRNDEGFNLHASFDTIELRGFENNTQDAIKKYFEYYQIDDSNRILQRKFLREFNEPLFLAMFCIVAHRNIHYMTKDFTYSDLFHQYIKYRNDNVSKGIDEDTHRNVTEKALLKFASYSLYYNNCNPIPRKKARHYTDLICRNRTWSNSLLYWLLKENLMLSMGLEGESLMFGYQKMGDFLMADIFAHNKMSDEAKIDFILEKGNKQEFTGFQRFIIALLSEWDLTSKLLEKEHSKRNGMVFLILNSLKIHGKNNRIIIDWMQKHHIYNLRILHDFFYDLPLDVFFSVHNTLLNLDLATRDKTWTVMVNQEYSRRYDEYKLRKFINIEFDNNSNDNWRKYVILLCWMCTSPHPFLRGCIMRKLVKTFDDNPSMTSFVLEIFHNCNDPYVVQVCTCAIYGHLLRTHIIKECTDVAQIILKYFYSDNKAPDDILVRQWTMLILAFADELNGNDDFMSQIKPPFLSQNPYDLIKDDVESINNEYFGNSRGARRMHETLYGFSDFKRYIIGTNNRNESNVFMKVEDEGIKGIPLTDILLLIANIAKHDLGWNDDLGKLDDNIYSEGRYNNLIERFGKKFLWLALYKVDALLSDHLKVIDENKYVYTPKAEDVEPIPYPWHTREYSRIDPSILSLSETLPYDSFRTEKIENVKNVSNEQWLGKDYPIQNPRLIVTDKDDSRWIVLTCYDGHKTEGENETLKDLFLFSNAAFIHKDDLEVFKVWAKEQNFYGRWMPECMNGSTAFLWNEYPWANTYKRTIREIEKFSSTFQGKTFTLQLSYEAQLQEDWIGLNENEINLKKVNMPNHQVMEYLNLYTAERGIIRDKKDQTIVARNFAIGKMYGLTMRKDYLDKYLQDNHLSLVFYSLGEKYVTIRSSYQGMGRRHDLSGAYYYEDGNILEIQPMHISNTL